VKVVAATDRSQSWPARAFCSAGAECLITSTEATLPDGDGLIHSRRAELHPAGLRTAAMNKSDLLYWGVRQINFMTAPIEKRNIRALNIRFYGDSTNGQTIVCEPTSKDICDALQAGRLETRNYQTDFEALKAEWVNESQKSSNPLETWRRLVTNYHAGRIAHFVENGWDHPISVNSNDEVTDGTHRVKAAIFKGFSEVEVTIQQ